MTASLSDLPHGDSSGPGAGQGAATAGAGRNSARGWNTRGAGAGATANSLDTACGVIIENTVTFIWYQN